MNTTIRSVEATRELIGRRLAEREVAYAEFFAAEAPRLARLCHAMAERFARDGRLIAVGVSPQARSDVRHVTVEFVHPVIVGKRALPALGLSGESGRLAAEVEMTAASQDIMIAFGEPQDGAEVTEAVLAGREAGALTIAFASLGAEAELDPGIVDPFVRQELVETTYHVLWELVHVFFDHRGLLEGRARPRTHDAGAASFLYPFLSEGEDDLAAVLDDVAASARAKARDVSRLRRATLTSPGIELARAAATLRDGFTAGGRLLALGNGGSATDATDAVADFMTPPPGVGWPGRPAIDLCADTAVITAVANDIGVEAIFARQIIAHGRVGDIVIAFSTSGNSLSVLAALAEARQGGLATIALVGYGGGRVAAQQLADHVIVSPSEHIPRIQEAQATVSHLLRELVETG